MKTVLVLFLCTLFLFGCSGQHCIKIGGNYEGIEGNIEYCFDKKDSEEAGRPIITSESGQKLLAISENDAAKLNKLIEKNETKAIKTKAITLQKPPFARLLEHLFP